MCLVGGNTLIGSSEPKAKRKRDELPITIMGTQDRGHVEQAFLFLGLPFAKHVERPALSALDHAVRRRACRRGRRSGQRVGIHPWDMDYRKLKPLASM
jgi:hypothetical protein